MYDTHNDKLDYMLYMIASDCCQSDVEKFDNIDDSNITFSKRFYKKRDKIIRKYKYRPIFRTLRSTLVKAAIIIMIIMSICFVTIMAIDTLRESVFEAIIEWHDNYIKINFEKTGSSETTDITTTTGNLGDGDVEPVLPEPPTPPTWIEDVRKPQLLPVGVIEDIVIQSNTMVYIDYYLNNDLLFSFKQSLLVHTDIYIDSESVLIENVDINGYEGSVIEHTSKNEISIVWNDGEYVYHINTQSKEIDYLLSIAKTVYSK